MKNGQFDQILIRTQGGQALFRETCVGPSEEAMSRHGVHNRLCRQILKYYGCHLSLLVTVPLQSKVVEREPEEMRGGT